MNNFSGLVPLGHAVLIAPYEQESINSSVIQMPDSVRERSLMVDQKAIVIAVGTCAWNDEPEPRAVPGDAVLIGKFSGYMAKGNDGKQYRLVNDRDIFARILPEGKANE